MSARSVSQPFHDPGKTYNAHAARLSKLFNGKYAIGSPKYYNIDYGAKHELLAIAHYN